MGTTKVVVNLTLEANAEKKRRAMLKACNLDGLESVTVGEDKRLTAIGVGIDSMKLVRRIRTICKGAELEIVGSVKGPEKKKEEAKKEEPNKGGDKNKDGPKQDPAHLFKPGYQDFTYGAGPYWH